MFKFEEMITPKIIGLLYVITLIITGLMIIGCLLDHQIGGAIGAVLIFIFSRVFFELLIVKFKNNEYLRDSRDYLQRIAHRLDEKGNPPADDFGMDDVVKNWNADGKGSEKNGDGWR